MFPGPFAAATIAPVDGLIATIALAGLTVLRMCSASSCSRGSRVRWSGVPSTGSARKSLVFFPSGSTASIATPGVPRSCSSYRASRPDSPASSPTEYTPGLSLMISAVTGPTEPRIGAANSLVMPSGTSSAIASTPLMSLYCDITVAGTSSRRNAIACTNALSPAAFTCLTYGAASMPTSWARRRAESGACAAPTLSRSTPKRTTGRSVIRPTPCGPRMSARVAPTVVASRVSPAASDGWMMPTFHATAHVSPWSCVTSGIFDE